ncbi:BlaI/MecI/CopY family transcriptional regulator [Parabacteroides sp. OttesenSCG-928-G06]|nr:BlaI/MecI/CopY family transcriptional regulator [Parabacteroides sp. OttesenSCG-928-G06]
MQLTRAEEQVMQYLWQLGEGAVQEIRECFADSVPSRTTVSTIIRILETKGFVDHKAGGRGFIYYPLVAKKEYSRQQLFGMMKDYFNNSFSSMASFFAQETNLSAQEMEKILEETKRELEENKSQ